MSCEGEKGEKMKKAFVDYQKAKEIAETYPTPFYLYDEEGIRDTV